jgi:hypothetical protein
MNRERHAFNNDVTWMNPGNAFRAQLIRSMPGVPVVVPAAFGTSDQKYRARASHWLSRFVTHPDAVAVCRISEMRDHSERNIADWSSYLPADCVATMISLGWDRTC